MRKARIRWNIHPAAFVVWVIAFLLLDSCTVIATICALLIHECAHVIAIVLLDTDECHIELTPFGGMIDARGFANLSTWKQLIIACAGVIASGLAATICFFASSQFSRSLFHANASLAFVNLLPCWPLDGARMMVAVASLFGKEQMIRNLLSIASFAIAVIFLFMGLYGVWQGIVNFSLLAVGPYLLYVSHSEKIGYKVRKVSFAAEKENAKAISLADVYCIRRQVSPYELASQMIKLRDDKYHIFVWLDPTTGCILKTETQEQVMQHLIEMESTGTPKS